MDQVIETPTERYTRELQDSGFTADSAQRMAVDELQNLFDRILMRRQRAASFRGRIEAGLGRALEPEKGLYFWGGVGRGKTYLMDMFFESLPFDAKLRVHFHRFMQRVHTQLSELEGEKNPLELFVRQLSRETELICFDEFFVSDIADAMILANCLEAMFRQGITLVATSNIEPRGLYKDGLQRSRFLPAIALLEKHTKVLNVDSGVDYRLRTLEEAALFHTPDDHAAEKALVKSFEAISRHSEIIESVAHTKTSRLQVNGRPILCERLAQGAVWFEFHALCDGPRSQNDYIEIAREFHTVVVSGVPKMGPAEDDLCRRFINLVDEFYDRNVKLLLSAAASIRDLYSGVRLEFEFQRTVSRLLEMQSRDYLAREHRP
ncbi:MAG: cell division protein ZapE [Pseudomonadota bacterium]